jgi:hypothetical protein
LTVTWNFSCGPTKERRLQPRKVHIVMDVYSVWFVSNLRDSSVWCTIFVQIFLCVDYKNKKETLVLEDCILGCFQLIWIHGVQEFVLCVLGDMHGALSVCIWRMPVSQSG